MVVNVTKTEEMIFDPRSICEPTPVLIHNTPIQQVTSYKYLGVFIDCSLTWHIHVENQVATKDVLFKKVKTVCVNSKLLFLFFQMILECDTLQHAELVW